MFRLDFCWISFAAETPDLEGSHKLFLLIAFLIYVRQVCKRYFLPPTHIKFANPANVSAVFWKHTVEKSQINPTSVTLPPSISNKPFLPKYKLVPKSPKYWNFTDCYVTPTYDSICWHWYIVSPSIQFSYFYNCMLSSWESGRPISKPFLLSIFVWTNIDKKYKMKKMLSLYILIYFSLGKWRNEWRRCRFHLQPPSHPQFPFPFHWCSHGMMAPIEFCQES